MRVLGNLTGLNHRKRLYITKLGVRMVVNCGKWDVVGNS
jgi:hypothetical protein